MSILRSQISHRTSEVGGRKSEVGNRLVKLSVILVLTVSTAVSAQPVTPQPNVVILLPLSGDYGHIGTQLLDSLTLALDESSGVSWTVLDTEGDARRARRLVVEAAANPANLAVLGPVGAAESRAAAEAAMETGIPLLTLTSEAGVELAGFDVFRLRVSPELQARQIARIALERLELRRFGILYPDDAYGRSTMRAFADEVLRAGGRITALEAYELDETNFNEPVELLTSRRYRSLRGRPFRDEPRASVRRLSSVSEVDFDAIFIPDYHERVGLILPFLAFWDIPIPRRVQLLGISSWGGPGLQVAGELADGALFTQIYHQHMWSSDAGRYTDTYVERFARLPSEAEAQAYDAIRFLLHVLSHPPRDGLSRATLRRALLDAPPFMGVAGPMELDVNGGVVRELSLFSADSGGFVGPYQLLR